MSPKLRVVLEKLAREPPEKVLKALLTYELDDEDVGWRYCCLHHPRADAEHGPNCQLDEILTNIGLPDREAREAMRKELGIESD